jgi:outer membrane protein assembly factor BamB
MKNARNKTAIAIAIFMTLTMTVSLVALPVANAQSPLQMNLPGSTQPYPALIHSSVDIDLNGGPGANESVELWIQYPGRADFTYIDTYTTRSNGDLDVYDFDFNETGIFACQWRLPAPSTEESNVEYVDCVLVLPPSANRQILNERFGDPPQIPTYLFVVGSPNPVGVGQTVSFIMMNPQQPPGASASNDVRYQYSMKVEDPDGVVETLGPFTSDATGTAYTLYTPDKVGNWTVTVTFNELLWEWPNTDYNGATFLASSDTITIVVQEEPVNPSSWVPTPLPTEYWVRPIEGQNTDWWRVASNYLAGPGDKNYYGSENRWQRDGAAPNSAHIMWTKPVEDGGLVGGGNFSVPGEVFNAGHQYQTRFTNPIIMWGRLYYEIPVRWSGGGGGWMCVDLRTGEEIWYEPFGVSGSGMSEPSFGYYYDLDNMNNHGVVTPGWLFTNNFGASIHPRYGTYGDLELEGVPSGYEILGPKGEHLRYEIYNDGSFSDPDYHLRQWNSSKVFDDSETGTRTVNDGDYDWDVPMPIRNGMTGGSITTRIAVLDDILVGSNGSHPVGTNGPQYHRVPETTFWAVSLKPGNRGQKIWMKNIEAATEDNTNVLFERAGEGVLCFVRTPKQSWMGYDMYTGNKLWETGNLSDINPFGYYSFPSLIHVESSSIAYGTLFTGGYVGHVSAWNITTGELMWRYAAPTQQRIFLYYTLMLGAIADGKIYVGTHEHSADTPLFKGNRVRALNVTTGEEVWTMAGWAHPGTFAIADGTLVYWNNYDHQVYAVGKGPTTMTASAAPKVTEFGSSLIVEGSVMDISAGTEQEEQARRFPKGVPAVSEESMPHWMEYVYMQKARPANATGVEVQIDVMDANGNYRNIGSTTSDASGFYSFEWTPDIPGKYTVYATFAGSEGYWGSFAETAFSVAEAPEATPPPTEPPAPATDMYVLGSTAGIIIAIVAVGLVIILMLRKR